MAAHTDSKSSSGHHTGRIRKEVKGSGMSLSKIYLLIFVFIGIIFIAFGIKGLMRSNSSGANTDEFRMYLVNQDGSQTPFGKWYSMDSVAQVNSHLKYNYNDPTRGLNFISKGPVDIYFPSKRKPGTWIHKHYCGKGVFDWSELKELCTLGTIEVFKSDDTDCE